MNPLLSLHLSVLIGTLALAGPPASAPYRVHEWGTFTSVQGADGRPLEWNPLVVADLPEFVYDLSDLPPGERRGTRRRFVAKTAIRTLQRMETPVIYFHADQPVKVDVEVQFPKGLVTEWYPQARPLPRSGPAGRTVSRDRIAWDDVRVLPRDQEIPLPADSSGSHYYAARGAAANSLEVPVRGGRTESERFLFYRGVGNFEAPLRVHTDDEARTLSLRNLGARPLDSLWVVQIRHGRGSFQRVDALRPEESRDIRVTSERHWSDLGDLSHRLRDAVRADLIAAGLAESEASAMVATWEESWFTESGLRVLYVLPKDWVDEILPLRLDPAPQEVVRVFVGRAEVITPAMEFALLRQLLRYSDGNEGERAAAVEEARALDLGRFAEPAVRRLLASVPPNRTFSNRAWELLEALSFPATPTAPRDSAVESGATTVVRIPASLYSCSATPNPPDQP